MGRHHGSGREVRVINRSLEFSVTQIKKQECIKHAHTPHTQNCGLEALVVSYTTAKTTYFWSAMFVQEFGSLCAVF